MWIREGYAGEEPEDKAAKHGIYLEVISHTEAKRGFLLQPLRWVVERNFAWSARFRDDSPKTMKAYPLR